jgi:hypothetical protein
MGQTKFSIREAAIVPPCPKCGNKTKFVAHGEQCAEDCCEIWVRCECGYDPSQDQMIPSAWGIRLEDVWGDLAPEKIHGALYCSWIEPLTEHAALLLPTAKKDPPMSDSICHGYIPMRALPWDHCRCADTSCPDRSGCARSVDPPDPFGTVPWTATFRTTEVPHDPA